MAEIQPIKKEMTFAEKKKLLNKASESLNTKAKKTVCGFASDPEIANKLTIRFIPTKSQNLNAITGGGYPRGKISIIAGESDSGKTSNAAETIGYNMQRDPNFFACWLESENSLSKDYLCDTFGIDPERFFFIEHEKNGAGEAAIDALESVIGTGAVQMAVVNSLKCLVPSEEFRKQMGEFTIGSAARMNAKMIRKLTSLTAETDTALILISHLTTEIGNMYDPLQIAGGRAIRYASMLTLDFRKRSIQESDPIGKEDGLKININVKKNHCTPNRNPYLKTDIFVIFGEGTEQYLETLENAASQGVLTKAGSWIYDMDEATGEPKVIDGFKYAWQGKQKFREFCKANNEYFEQLQARVRGEFVQMSSDEIESAIAEEEKDLEATNSIIENSGSEDVIEEAKAKKTKKK